MNNKLIIVIYVNNAIFEIKVNIQYSVIAINFSNTLYTSVSSVGIVTWKKVSSIVFFYQ